MSRATPLGLLGAAPALPDLDRRRRELEHLDEELAEARKALLFEFGGLPPKTAEERAKWAALIQAREVLELERDCLELERRRVGKLREAAQAAPAHRWAPYAGHVSAGHAREAEGLLGQLRRKRHELAAAMQRGTVQEVARV